MIEKSEPGAAQYGNFINYYQFNPASNRMTALSDEFWTNLSKRLPENVCCLDVGCNSGELSFALCERLKSLGKNCVFLCLDIDSVLIQRSIENFSFEPALTFKTLDITNVEDQKEITNFLGKWGKLNFDLIFCFSTTLWIHINYGDDVLLNTIKYLCGMTNNLVIEPQAWKSYRQAVRRVRKLAKNIFDDKFSQLKIRSDVVDVIGKIISEAGFELHEVGVSEWKRQILVCEKRYP